MIDGTNASYKSVTIVNPDDSVVVIKPVPGQHLMLFAWDETCVLESEKPGIILYHCGADVAAKLLDRMFKQDQMVWENLQRLWAWQHHVTEWNKERNERLGQKKRWQ